MSICRTKAGEREKESVRERESERAREICVYVCMSVCVYGMCDDNYTYVIYYWVSQCRPGRQPTGCWLV